MRQEDDSRPTNSRPYMKAVQADPHSAKPSQSKGLRWSSLKFEIQSQANMIPMMPSGTLRKKSSARKRTW